MKKPIFLYVFIMLFMWLSVATIGATQYCATELNNTNGKHTVFLTCKSLGSNQYEFSLKAQDAISSFNSGSNVYAHVNGNDAFHVANALVKNDNTLSATITSTTIPKFYAYDLYVNYSDGESHYVIPSDIEWGVCSDEGCVLSSAKVVAEGYSAAKIQVELGADCQSVIVATNKTTSATSELAIVEESGKQYVYLKGLNAETEYTYTLQAKDQSGALVPTAGIDVTFATRCNIAQGKTVSVSSDSSDPNLVAAKANDGDVKTRWQAKDVSLDKNPWWQVDLGEIRSVVAIEILWEQAWGKGFDIEFSTDGNTWTGKHSITQDLSSIVSDGKSWPYTQLIALNSTQKARYVRFTGTVRGNGNFSFYEFRVLSPCDDTPEPADECTLTGATVVAEGFSSAKIELNMTGDCQTKIVAKDEATQVSTDVDIVVENGKKYIYLKNLSEITKYNYTLYAKDALGTVVPAIGVQVSFSTQCNIAVGHNATASSNSAGATASNDGNAGTRWQGDNKDGEWWQVDLGTEQSFYAIEILWEAAYGKKFEIQCSNDGSSWTTIKTIDRELTNANNYTELIAFERSQQARYVRYQGITRGFGYGDSFYEFRVVAPCQGCELMDAKVVAGYTTARVELIMTGDCQQVIKVTDKSTKATADYNIVEENGHKYIYLSGLAVRTAYNLLLQTKDRQDVLVPEDGIDVTFSTLCNMAEGQVATASDSENENLGPEKAVDGIDNSDNASRWQAAPKDRGHEQPWWMVDLCMVQPVSSIEILWDARWGNFDIEFSLDGVDWYGKQSVEPNLNGKTFPYAELVALDAVQQARYVRFTGTERKVDNFAFWEFRVLAECKDCALTSAKAVAEGYTSAKIEVEIDGNCEWVVMATDKATGKQTECPIEIENGKRYIYLKDLDITTPYTYLLQTKDRDGNISTDGVEVSFATRCNVAEGQFATASKSENIDLTPGKATDGSTADNSRWQAATQDKDATPWWQVDLSVVQQVSAIEILWNNQWGKQFDIEFSEDGTSWFGKHSITQDLRSLQSTPSAWPYTELIALDAVQEARYVRFTGNQRGDGSFSFREFRVLTKCDVDLDFRSADVKVVGVKAAKIEVDVDGESVIIATNKKTGVSTELKTMYEDGKKYVLLTGLGAKTQYTFVLQAKDQNGNLAPADGIEVSFKTHCNLALDNASGASSGAPANGNDDQDNTIWDSSHNDGQTWHVDLEEITDVAAIEIVWGDAWPRTFKVEYSKDGNPGEFVEYRCNTLSKGTTTLFAVNKEARVVRFYGGERGTNWGYAFSEFRVASECTVDDNLVLDKVCKGSESHDATQSGSRDPNTANNNDRWGTIDANVWRSAANKDIWWQADLHTYKNGDLTEDSVYSLNKVLLYWRQENGNCTPKNIRVDIAYATNPTEADWYSVGNSLLLTADKKNGNQVFTFDFNGEITARWIRIYGTGGANNQAGNVADYGYRLTEVEGYGGTDLNEQHAKPSVEAEVSAVAVESARLRLSGNDIDQTRKVHCFHVVNKNDENQYWNASLRDNNELTVANLKPDTYYELLVYSLDEWGRMSDPQTVTFTTLHNCSNDFATNKPIYASSSQAGYDAKFAVDGDKETRWGTQWEGVSDEVRKNQWLLIDLGKNEILDEITIMWETAAAATFQLLAVEDGATINTTTGEITNGKQWTILHNQQTPQYLTYQGSSAEASYPFEHTKARYVKFKGISTLSTWGYSMYEIRVFGCADTVPPHIVNAEVIDLTCSSATIKLSGRDFDSDKETETVVNSFIAYPLDKDGNEIADQRVIWSPAGITAVGESGTFVLDNLQMDTTYHYHVYAQDMSRNVSRVYADLTITMPRCEFVIYHHGQTPTDNTENAVEEYAGGVIEYPIVYKRKFIPGRWETLCLPFDVESITIYDADDGQDYELYAQYYNGTGTVEGYFWLRTFTVKGDGVAVTADDFQPNWEDIHASSDQEALPKKNVAYIMQMPDAGGYYDNKFVEFHGKRKQYINERFAFPALPADDYYTYSGNTTMMPQKPTSAYVLTNDGLYFSSATKQTLYPFECMVNATQTTIAKMPQLPLNKRPGVTTGNQLPTTVADNGSVWTIVGGYVGQFDNMDEYRQLVECLPEGMYIIRCGTQSSKLYLTK